MKKQSFLKRFPFVLHFCVLVTILFNGCNSTKNPQTLESPDQFKYIGQIPDQIHFVKPGVVYVRFRQTAVNMQFSLQPKDRGLERLKLSTRELKVLDSMGLVQVRRAKPQLEQRTDNQITVYTEARLREKLNKSLRIGKSADAFKGIERDMILTFRPDINPDVLCQILKKFPSIEECQVNTYEKPLVPIIPNDPHFIDQWGFNNTAAGSSSQAPNFDIDAPEAWDINKGNASVVVAVNDAGVDIRHPDLYEKIWINVNELPDAFVTQANALSSDQWPDILTFTDINAFSADPTTQASMAALRTSYNLVDGNANGYIDGEDLYNAFRDDTDNDPSESSGEVDDIVGWDFKNNDPLPFSNESHGTAVAGLVGAVANNSIDVAGVGWNTRIMAINSDYWWPSVEYAIKHKASIITSSLDPSFSLSLTINGLLADLNNERIPFTAALGNINRYSGGTVFAESPYTIAISNFKSTGIRDQNDGSSFSVNTDVAGPGAGTWSLNIPSGAMSFGGTSGANPIVAGTLSLVMAERTGLTPEQYRQVLRKSAVDVPSVTGDLGENTSGFDYYSGWGLTNARNALTMVNNDPWAEAKITSQRRSYWAINRKEEMHIIGASSAVTAFAGIPGGGQSQVILDWAPGTPPDATTWSTISSSTRSYVNDDVMGTLNRSVLASGVNTLRLAVTSNGNSFTDYGRVDVPHAYMDLPDNTLILPNTEIRGFAFHPQFASYELQVASGHNADPSNSSLWSVVSTSTTERPPVVGGIGYTDQILFSTIPIFLLPNGEATLRTVVKDASNNQLASYSVPVIVDNTIFPYQNGFPADFSSYPYRFGGPATYDINGDNNPEIIVTDQFDVYVYKNTGTILAGWPVYIGMDKLIAFSPAIGDINGDGMPEIVIRSNKTDSRKDIIYVLGRDGTLISPWPLNLGTFPGGWRSDSWAPNTPIIDFAPVLADLDSDGDLEILIAGQPENSSSPSGVFAYQGNGSLWRSYTIPNAEDIPIPPACGDIDNDGEIDIIAITKQGSVNTVTAWRADGNQLFSSSLPSGWTYPFTMVLADLDGDLDLEIVVQMFNRHLRAFHHDGSIVSGWNDIALNNISYCMSVGDLTPSDGNCLPSVIVPYFKDVDPSSVYDFQYGISIVSPDGSITTGWENIIDKGDVTLQPIVMDVDNDGAMEILIGSFRQYDTDNPPFTKMVAYNYDGTPVSDDRFPIYFAGALPRTPTIADIDQDGDLEVCVASNKWGGPLEVIDLDALNDGGAIAWGMQLHDPLRSSNYHGGVRILEPTTTKPTDVGSPSDVSIRNSLLIRLRNELSYGIPDASNVTVRIGESIAPIVSSTRVEGETWLLVVPPNQTNSGLYKLELEWNDGGIRRFTSQKDAIRYSATSEPTDQVLVIDRSGSMMDYEKYLASRTAANFYVNAQGAMDNIGLVTFNTQASDNIPGVLLLGPDGSVNRAQIAGKINTTPTPSGSTSIGQGLKIALLNVLPSKTPERKRALVLLSDGLENTAPFWETGANSVNILFEQPENEDVVIHTIALGPDADRDLHGRIAEATGGTSRFVYLGYSESLYARLADAYRQVDEIVNCEQRIFTEVDSIAEGISKSYLITVPNGAMYVSFCFSYRNSNANVDIVEVRKPDGTIIPSEAMTIVNGYSSKVLTLSAPQSGYYQITIISNLSSSEVLMTSSVKSAQTLVASIAWPEKVEKNAIKANLLATVFNPQSAAILQHQNATIFNSKTVKATCSYPVQVTARIVAPDKSVTILPMLDDGMNRDGFANDGVFGIPIMFDKGGGYAITVNAIIRLDSSAKVNDKYVLEKTIGFFQPRAKDSDMNGIDDTWENLYYSGLSIKSVNPLCDYDADGLNEFEEFLYKTNPLNYDTDNDGQPDGPEVDKGTDPLISNPKIFTEEDSDGDGLPDTWEKRFFPEMELLNIVGQADPDQDSLPNYTEWRFNTNPRRADSDGNGIMDKDEESWQLAKPDYRTVRPMPSHIREFILPKWLIILIIGIVLIVIWIIFKRRN